MPVQTDYTTMHAVALEGQEGDLDTAGQHNISRTAEAAVAFGKPVSQGTGDHGVVPFATAPTKFVGVTIRDQAADGTTPDTYRQYDTAGVKRRGTIWVKVGEAVVAGDPVYLTAAGAFMKTATSNTLVSGARYETTAALNGLALLRL
ncbi:MAG: hypothetical protein K2Y56_23990 [Methylobacterium sp.]|uniref:structural cement protein Gp24 n=1 Tax=Methylobacterium sp. TaxID=409 RepID=UPI0025DE5485|nr:hypothetical protein [Methylobacterium sp.]MBX9934539.1 hypothetical protein [Methylobacterium sp.]